MPVTIAVANPKGGVSKTTTALILATGLARQGAAVSIIDADPNRHLVAWRAGASKSPVRVVADSGRLVPLIDAERAAHDVVIVDLEGSASRAVGHAVARADLVLVPLQATAMDAGQAARAVDLVREEEAVVGRAIAVRLLLTRTSPAIPSRAEKLIIEEMRGAGLPLLRERLHQRTAFAACFAYKLALHELDEREVNGLPAALANAEALTAEVTDVLNSIHARRAA
jgi:chromosome partitioning protein